MKRYDDESLPGCGVTDERGWRISCEDCIWGSSCLDSVCREEDEEDADEDA